MAKEEDVKKIELKVSVNCCDGCRKKVLKALSIQGVLKTDIHPSLPRVTVLGNVEPQTLIKKLAKCGKTAEVWPAEPQKQAREEKKSDSTASSCVPEKESAVEVPVVKGANEKPKDAGDGVKKYSGSCEQEKNARSEDKSKPKQGDHQYRCCGDGDRGEGKAQKELAEDAVGGEVVKNANPNCATATQPATVTTALPPQANYVLNPSTVDQDSGALAAPPFAPHVYYAVEPYPAPVASYYTANAYVSPPPPCCAQDHYYYHPAPPVFHHCPPPPAPVPSLPPQFGDYFNDENTVGCGVM